MREVPPEVIASWPEPNYVNPESRGDSIVIAASICIPIVAVVFVCRVYSRVFISKFFGWDDWLIIPSVLFGLGYSCATLAAINVGWYKHIWDLTPDDVKRVRQLVIVCNVFGLYNVAFTKLSILCLYLHISPPSRFQTIVYILFGVTSAWLVALTVASFLLCIPLHAYWEVAYTGKHTCVSEVGYYVAFTSVDLALDTIIYLLPLPVLIPLKMPKRQKFIVMVVFGVGILVIASTAIRLPSLIRTSASYDLTWELYDAALWTEVESTVGIVCASAPALKPLIQRYMPAVLGSPMSSERANGSASASRRTRNSNYANRRTTDDFKGRGGWAPPMMKNGSDVGLVHELGFISGTEHLEDGRGRGVG